MADSVFKIGKTHVQHGPENNRIYIMRLDDDDMPGLLNKVDSLALKNDYGKIFAKVPRRWMSVFREKGYSTEAVVPFFFHGIEDCYFMARFYDPQRSFEPGQKKLAEVISLSRDKGACRKQVFPRGYTLRACTRNDSTEMARLYGDVFASYPFPIDDGDFLQKSMADNVTYFGIWSDAEKLVALASAEQDPDSGNVEMTDFVTDSSFRNQGCAKFLLERMEEYMKQKKFFVAYTIARARSVGMNRTFARSGYSLGGTLIRNTQICGKLESMNVWYKHLK